ncbi:MAG: hypothetical protein JSW54_04490, partial [Fidelibacterota bacterium]
LLYLEYKSNADFSEREIEGKLILAKDFGQWNLAFNPILELEHEDEWEVETGYALGLSTEVHKVVRLGLEFKGNSHAHYIGPVISHGTKDLWVALGSGIRLGGADDGRPGFQIRLLTGIGF